MSVIIISDIIVTDIDRPFHNSFANLYYYEHVVSSNLLFLKVDCRRNDGTNVIVRATRLKLLTIAEKSSRERYRYRLSVITVRAWCYNALASTIYTFLSRSLTFRNFLLRSSSSSSLRRVNSRAHFVYLFTLN